MKKMFVLSMLVSLAMICSCQKQGSATERQLAQRKTELDAREETLDQRDKELALRETVLNERERALAEQGKPIANGRTIPIPPNLQSRPIPPRDPEQLKAEIERRRQQGLPPRDPEELKAEKERLIQQLPPQFQALIKPPDISEMRERLRRTQGQMQNNAAIPATTAAPGAVYPSAEATSPSPSPTPQ